MKLLACLFSLVTIHYATSTYCREGFIKNGNSCYGFGEEFVTWQEAAQYCASDDSRLVEIDNAKENAFIVQVLRDRNFGSVWTGGSERNHRGVWEWAKSRRRFGSFSDWYGNEPQGPLEDCLAIDAGLGYKWNDLTCEIVRIRFVCEARLEQNNRENEPTKAESDSPLPRNEDEPPARPTNRDNEPNNAGSDSPRPRNEYEPPARPTNRDNEPNKAGSDSPRPRNEYEPPARPAPSQTRSPPTARPVPRPTGPLDWLTPWIKPPCPCAEQGGTN